MFGERPKRSGIMLCYPFEQARLEGPSRKAWNQWPVLTQPKLDGERCRALFDAEGRVLLLSSTEEPIVSVPHIVRQLEETGLRSLELDGELYVHGMSFEEIHSRVSRTVNMHAEYEQIEYHVFDVVNSSIQIERSIQLETTLGDSLNKGSLKTVLTNMANSFEEVIDSYKSYCTQGYEGIIVRRIDAPYLRQRSTAIMKFKSKKSDVYRILGTQEEIDKHGEPKGSLGALTCCGDDGTPFNVGTGFNAEQRQSLWTMRDRLPGMFVRINYQAKTEKGVPRFPVFAEILAPPERS